MESLQRGLSVIEAFDGVDAEMTLSQVAQKVFLKPATARRSLRTLVHLGYVHFAKGRYSLSARVLALGTAYLRSSSVEQILLPELTRLVTQLGDTAAVGVRVDRNVVYVAYHFVPGRISLTARTGFILPAYASSMGRVFLANMPAPTLATWLKQEPLTRHTKFTITEPARLRAALKLVREQGYAFVRDELALGLTALAVPIFGPGGEVIAALNTSAYSGQCTPFQLVKERLEALKGASQRISNIIARHPTLHASFITDAAPLSA